MDFEKLDLITADDCKKLAKELHFKINQLLNEVEIPEHFSYNKKYKMRGVVEDGKASLRRLTTFHNFIENWQIRDEKQVLSVKDVWDIWGPIIKGIQKTKDKLEKMVPGERIAVQPGPTLPFYTNPKNK